MNPATNTIAINIVKTVKTIVETVLDDIEKKKSFKELFPIIDIEKYKNQIEERSFNLDLFDKPDEFYNDLNKYLNYYLEEFFTNKNRNIIKLESSFAIINFSALTELLLQILENDKNSYKEDIIKFDIACLCEIIANKNQRLNNSDTFFLNCLNELKKKYNNILPKTNNFITKMEEYFMAKAKQILNEVKDNLYDYISQSFHRILKIYQQKNTKNMQNEEEYEQFSNKLNSIKLSYEKFTNDEGIKRDLSKLKKVCKETEIYNYFKEYSEYLSKLLGYAPNDETKQKYILENFILPFNLLDIQLNEENAKIIYGISYDKNATPKDYSNFGESFYEQFLNKKKEIDYINANNYNNEIGNFIYKDDDFMKNFYSILKSKPVSNYLSSKRKYDECNPYLVKFIFDDEKDIKTQLESMELKEIEKDKEKEEPDQCLKLQYKQFLSDIENDYQKFRNLIRIKELSYNIPALTGPSMKIFINPKLDFSEDTKKDEEKMKSILKSALYILLIHEIAHLLKYYPINNKYPQNYPKTPKERENGKCLIYYLFGRDYISKINYDQSCLINNSDIWDSGANLKSIFLNYPKDLKRNDGKCFELDLYFSGKNSNNKIKKKTDYCFW